MLDAWVSRSSFLPPDPLPRMGGSFFALKLRRLTHAWIRVPSTLKCSLLSRCFAWACFTTARRSRSETSPAISRSRFLVNTVTSQTASSIVSPTNQRKSRL